MADCNKIYHQAKNCGKDLSTMNEQEKENYLAKCPVDCLTQQINGELLSTQLAENSKHSKELCLALEKLKNALDKSKIQETIYKESFSSDKNLFIYIDNHDRTAQNTSKNKFINLMDMNYVQQGDVNIVGGGGGIYPKKIKIPASKVPTNLKSGLINFKIDAIYFCQFYAFVKKDNVGFYKPQLGAYISVYSKVNTYNTKGKMPNNVSSTNDELLSTYLNYGDSFVGDFNYIAGTDIYITISPALGLEQNYWTDIFHFLANNPDYNQTANFPIDGFLINIDISTDLNVLI